MGQHNFDTDIAKDYGIESAIILQNLSYWIEKNKANDKHFHDGLYWTYNTIKAFNELFPYMSESTIRRTMKSLEDYGIIKTGNYNKISYDRTMWYAITEKGLCILNKSILSNRQMEVSETSNGFSQNGGTIPDIKPVDKPHGKQIEESQDKPALPSKPKRIKKEFVIPTIEEVTEYVLEKQLVINPKDFIDYYAIRDWIDSQGNKVGNWKNRILDWHGRELKHNPGSMPYSKTPIPEKRIPREAKKCPKCGGDIRGSACVVCYTNFDYEGNEI